jgi:peptidoglycan/LPS O-acetylase OafA/YrhL
MSGSSTGRNAGIQWMRALAALLVVVDHGLFTLIDKAGGDPQWGPFAASLGGTGVELFFVISGFVMIVSSTGRFGSGAVAQFIRRRLTRIVPLYWLATAVYATKLVLVGDAPSVPNLARSLFFVPYLNLQGEMHPVYGLGWTLNHEVFFYAVFAVGLLWSLRATLAITAVTLGALVGFGFGLGEAGSTPFGQALFFWSRPIVLFFLVGMALPFLARRLNTSTAIDFRLAALMSMVLVGGAVAAGSSTSGLPWALALLGSAVLLLAHLRRTASTSRTRSRSARSAGSTRSSAARRRCRSSSSHSWCARRSAGCATAMSNSRCCAGWHRGASPAHRPERHEVDAPFQEPAARTCKNCDPLAVVQWTERPPPKRQIQVRFLSAGPTTLPPRTLQIKALRERCGQPDCRSKRTVRPIAVAMFTNASIEKRDTQPRSKSLMRGCVTPHWPAASACVQPLSLTRRLRLALGPRANTAGATTLVHDKHFTVASVGQVIDFIHSSRTCHLNEFILIVGTWSHFWKLFHSKNSWPPCPEASP